jgi:hypothetical protein
LSSLVVQAVVLAVVAVEPEGFVQEQVYLLPLAPITR